MYIYGLPTYVYVPFVYRYPPNTLPHSLRSKVKHTVVDEKEDAFLESIKQKIIKLIPENYGTPEQLSKLDVETVVSLHQVSLIEQLAKLTLNIKNLQQK